MFRVEKIAKFLLIGGLGVFVTWLSFVILKEKTLLTTLEIVIAVHFFVLFLTFLLQKHITFKSKAKTTETLSRFVVNDLIYLSLDYTFSYLFVDYFELEPAIGKFIALGLLTPISYTIQSRWVFK